MDKTLLITLQDLIRKAAEEYGTKTFIKEKSGSDIVEKSFVDLYDDSRKVASYLKEEIPGEKVHAAIIGATSYHYLVAYFGAIVGGNVTVPLDAQLSCEDICELMDRADVNAFFFDKRYEPMIDAIREACPNIKVLVALHEAEGADSSIAAITATYPFAELPMVSESDLASIVYTSGTTGKAKGVMLSHGNLIDNVICQDDESGTDQVLLTVLPIHHVYCFTCDILMSLRYGATVCINDSMMRIAQNLKLFQPTMILLVPMIAQTIYKQITNAAKAKNLPASVIAQAVFGGKIKMHLQWRCLSCA